MARRATSLIIPKETLGAGMVIWLHCDGGKGPRQVVICGRRTKTHILVAFPSTSEDLSSSLLTTTSGRYKWAEPEWVPAEREFRDLPLTKWPANRSDFEFEGEETVEEESLAEIKLESPGRKAAGRPRSGTPAAEDAGRVGELEERFGRLEAAVTRLAEATEAGADGGRERTPSGGTQDAWLIERARSALGRTGGMNAPRPMPSYRATADLFAEEQGPAGPARHTIGTPDRTHGVMGAQLRRLAETGADDEAMGAELRRLLHDDPALSGEETADAALRRLLRTRRHELDSWDVEDDAPASRGTHGSVSAIKGYEAARSAAPGRGRARWADLVRRLHQRVAAEGSLRTQLWTYFDRCTDLRRHRQMLVMTNALLEIADGVERNNKDQVMHGLTAGLLFVDQFCWDNGKYTNAQRVSLLGHPGVQYDKEAKQRTRVLDQPYAPLVDAELVGLATGAGKAFRALGNDLREQE